MTLQGSQKFAVLLCKFCDTVETEPHQPSYYHDLFVKRGVGGLNDYWSTASLGAINLDGSKVFGWKTIDVKQADYIAAHPGRWDKIKGAIDAFTDVDTTEFLSVVALFNVAVGDGGAAGGILGGPADANMTFLAHEMGHIFGLEHSFDMSSRRLESWSAEGEYFDQHDIMSAMNVHSDAGHQFSPRGPLLNVANMVRMGWLPGSRMWTPTGINSSATYDIDIVALEHPEIPGYLAANVGGINIEFRIPVGFDAGLPLPSVLLHQPANPSSVIVASDAINHINEWQPSQIYDATVFLLGQTGGVRITIVNFDLKRKVAKLRVSVMAIRPPFFEQTPLYRLGPGNTLVTLINGKIFRIPLPDPRLISLAENLADIFSNISHPLGRETIIQADSTRRGV